LPGDAQNTVRNTLWAVHVQMSPVPSASATAWCGYARKALHEAVEDPQNGVDLPPDVIPVLERFIDSWETQAAKEPTLSLSFDISTAEAEYLSHAFFRVATYLSERAQARGFDDAPEEGQDFYNALVEAVIDALERGEDDATAEFADYLRSFWPRSTDVPYGEAP